MGRLHCVSDRFGSRDGICDLHLQLRSYNRSWDSEYTEVSLGVKSDTTLLRIRFVS
jgi:hypothetical protein